MSPVYLVLVAGRCGAFDNADYSIHRSRASAYAAMNKAAPLLDHAPTFGHGAFHCLSRRTTGVGVSGSYGAIQAWRFDNVRAARAFEPRARIAQARGEG